MHCSIGDLADYARAHLNGLRGRGRLLEAESYQKLHAAPEVKIGGLTLGWGTDVDATFGRIHYGAGSGGTFFVRIWIAPESNLAVVVATNCGNGGAAQEVVGRLAHHAGWRGPQ